MAEGKKASKILNFLYIGSKSDAKCKKTLEELNIKYVLNCTPPRTSDPECGCPNFFEKERSFVYKRIPIFDNKGEDIISHIDTAFRFIEEGKHYGSVLVHCHKGVSRSASFVLAYLMKKNEMTLEEALGYVKDRRPIVAPNPCFLTQLESYQQQLEEERGPEDTPSSFSPSFPYFPSTSGPAICPPVSSPTTISSSSCPSPVTSPAPSPSPSSPTVSPAPTPTPSSDHPSIQDLKEGETEIEPERNDKETETETVNETEGEGKETGESEGGDEDEDKDGGEGDRRREIDSEGEEEEQRVEGGSREKKRLRVEHKRRREGRRRERTDNSIIFPPLK